MDSQLLLFHSSIWHKICIFLPFRDIFSLLLTCKPINKAINEHFKFFLRQQNLTNEQNEITHLKKLDQEENSTKTGKNINPNLITQQKYTNFLQYFYCREILYANFFDSLENFKINRLKKMNGVGIKNLNLGYKLSCISLHDGSSLFMKSDELFDSAKKMKTLKKEDLCKVETNSKNLVYLTTKREIFFLMFEENKPVNEMKNLKLKLKIPIFDFTTSFTHLVFIVRTEDLEEYDWTEGWNADYFNNFKNLKYQFFVLPLLEISEEIISNPYENIKVK
jgi:hypothetical protein